MMNKNLISTFEHICEWAGKTAGKPVETAYRKEEFYMVCNRCKRLLESILQHEQTQFMVAPILEHYFNILRPSIGIPVNELIAGDTSKLDECANFAKALAEHPVRHQWAVKAEGFREMAAQAGYEFHNYDYQDLATIAPIMIDALTTMDKTLVYSVRQGAACINTPPRMMDKVYMFNTIADAVHLYERVPFEAFVAFFGIEQTYGMNNNDMDDWLGTNARRYNVMRTGKSQEEYDNTVDNYSRKIYCVVRNGQNIWLFQPRVEQSGCECVGDEGKFDNFYGHRATYAPIQIFWKSTPGTTDCTALTVYQPKVFAMKEMLDEEQKVWLPLFFSTVKAHFFGEILPEAKKACIGEEIAVTMEIAAGNHNVNLPAIVHETMVIPDIPTVFSQDQVIDERGAERAFMSKDAVIKYQGAPALLKWMGITSDDIATAPMNFKGMHFEQAAKNKLFVNTVAAYYHVIRDRLPAFWKPHAAEATKWYHKYIHEHVEEIIQDALDGTIPARITIDKEPILNEDGTPKMQKKYGYGELVPCLQQTNIDLSKEVYKHPSGVYEYKAWFPASLQNKRPPISIEITPKCPEDVAKICRCNVSDLPMAIQMMNVTEAFVNREAQMRMNITLLFSKSEYKKRIK